MANTQLGAKAVGSIVKLNFGGSPKNFIVAHQGKPSSIYDNSCDGTWLLMEDLFENKQWHNTNVNDYEKSDIHTYLNGTILNKFDANIKAAIKQVKLPYHKGTGSGGTTRTGASGLLTKVFLLSGYELGFTTTDNQYFPVDGARLSYFLNGNGTDAQNKRIAKLNGSAANWWTRSPGTSNTTGVWRVHTGGSSNSHSASNTGGLRPALILPSSLLVSSDGNVSTNTPPTTPPSITVPEVINGGSNTTISWGASTDAEGNLSGYKVERSTNGGSTWSQIYQGSARTCTDNITFGWETVQYRVKAYDTEGEESGWRTSPQRNVFNNTAPTDPPSITVPLTVTGGGNITISWGASTDAEGNMAGYRLERKVGAGAWTQIYQGTALSYEDQITRGWETVQYRVRAYDTAGAQSSYTTSPTRTVDNNIAPTITSSSSGNLGVKDEGFTIKYTINDEDGDAVTVTENIDGVEKRSFPATLGTEYTFQVTGEYFMSLLNGQHTIRIKATDTGGKSATLELTFEKAVYKLRIASTEPMEADDLITKTVITVARGIPEGAEFKVLLTNNAKDPEPVWEDATQSVVAGINYLFENQTVANGHAYGFIVEAERAPGGEGGFIESIGGAFE